MKTTITETTYPKPIDFFLDVGEDNPDILGTHEFRSKLNLFRSQFKRNSIVRIAVKNISNRYFF